MLTGRPLLSALCWASSPRAWLVADTGRVAHLLVEWESVSVGLARLEALQVKQQHRELLATQDVLVTEGELQDILEIRQTGSGSLRQGRHSGGAFSLHHPSPMLALTFTAACIW